MWVARNEAPLRKDVAKIEAYREALRANGLAKLHMKPSFGWEGESIAGVRPGDGPQQLLGASTWGVNCRAHALRPRCGCLGSRRHGLRVLRASRSHASG